MINSIDIQVLISQLSPQNLFFLRQTSITFYNFITMRDIYNRIIENIRNRLKDIIGNNYEDFLKLMEKRNIAINGEFITQCVLDEHWVSDNQIYDANEFGCIILNVSYHNCGGIANIFDDYKVIDNNVKNDPIVMYNILMGWDTLKQYSFTLNDYEIASNRKLVLDMNPCADIMILDEHDHYDFYFDNISIFMNTFEIVNGKPNIHISNINKIMHKIEFIGPAYNDNYYNEENLPIIPYIEQFGFKCNNKALDIMM